MIILRALGHFEHVFGKLSIDERALTSSPPERDHVRVHDGGHGHQARAADARQRARAVEQDDVAGGAAAQAAEAEGDAGDEEADAAAEDVGDAPVEGLEGRAGDQVRGGEPGGGVGRVEFGADDRVRRRRDGPVEPVQEHVRHDGHLDPVEVPRRLPRLLLGRRDGQERLRLVRRGCAIAGFVAVTDAVAILVMVLLGLSVTVLLENAPRSATMLRRRCLGHHYEVDED